MKPSHILEPTVRAAINEDFCLFLVFKAGHPGLDSDIDPLHNPDWRRSRMELEIRLLQKAKEHLILLRQNWELYK